MVALKIMGSRKKVSKAGDCYKYQLPPTTVFRIVPQYGTVSQGTLGLFASPILVLVLFASLQRLLVVFEGFPPMVPHHRSAQGLGSSSHSDSIHLR